MKLAEKIKTDLEEVLKPYNGKVSDHNAEAGDTSFVDGHYHKTMIDAEGNGVTISTLIYTDQESRKKVVEDHVHKIVKYEIKSADGHSHDLIS